MMRRRLLQLITSPVGGTIMLLGVLFLGTAFYLHETGAFNSGPLSAAQPTGQPLGGFPSPAAWNPAQLTQHAFRLDHGGETVLACETCHIETYVENYCYGCHDHTPLHMEEVHLKEGLAKFDRCETCHPTGRPGEARHMMNENSGATENGASFAAAMNE